jgi:hypothetical protein
MSPTATYSPIKTLYYNDMDDTDDSGATTKDYRMAFFKTITKFRRLNRLSIPVPWFEESEQSILSELPVSLQHLELLGISCSFSSTSSAGHYHELAHNEALLPNLSTIQFENIKYPWRNLLGQEMLDLSFRDRGAEVIYPSYSTWLIHSK